MPPLAGATTPERAAAAIPPPVPSWPLASMTTGRVVPAGVTPVTPARKALVWLPAVPMRRVLLSVAAPAWPR